MKLSSLFVVGILIMVLAVMVAPVVKADGLPPGDPIVKAAGAGHDAPAAIITTEFTISSQTGTSPSGSPCLLEQPAGSPNPITTSSPNCQFLNVLTVNGVGQDIDALIFELPNIPLSSVNCATMIEGDDSVFGSCTTAGDGGDGTVVTFVDGLITYGSIFTLDFEGFPAGFTSSVDANVPEPGVLMLLLVGFVGLIGLGLKRSAVRV